MSVTSLDFIDFASSCIKRNDEIGFRNAVGRAYYGAYHHTIAKMVNGPKTSHAGLITYLQGDAWRMKLEVFDKRKLIALSHILLAMKSQRALSDYDLINPVTIDHATSAIKNGTNAVGLIDSL